MLESANEVSKGLWLPPPPDAWGLRFQQNYSPFEAAMGVAAPQEAFDAEISAR